MTKFKNLNKAIKEIAPYTGLGLQLTITVLIFWFIGKTIDDKYGTEPLWMITGSIFGIIIGMYNFIKSVIDLTKKKKDENDKNK